MSKLSGAQNRKRREKRKQENALSANVLSYFLQGAASQSHNSSLISSEVSKRVKDDSVATVAVDSCCEQRFTKKVTTSLDDEENVAMKYSERHTNEVNVSEGNTEYASLDSTCEKFSSFEQSSNQVNRADSVVNITRCAEESSVNVCEAEYVNVDVECEKSFEVDVNSCCNVNKEQSENRSSAASESNAKVDYSDPAIWPLITNSVRDIIVEQGPTIIEGPDSRFPLSNENRHFSTNYCQRVLANGEISRRRWLIYSESVDRVYCFCCKLFNPQSKSNLSRNGLDKWKHIGDYLKTHETSSEHFDSFRKWILAEQNLKKTTGIDTQLQKSINKEALYWRAILERLFSITLYLSKNNLAFRGRSDRLMTSNNGNFLGLVELLGQFDPVMMEHLRKVCSKEISDHYCGKRIQNEIINLLGDEVKCDILKRARQARYFSIISDCTPDINHIDQMSITLRFVDLTDITIKEHFLAYCQAPSSTGEVLTNIILKEMTACNLDMDNCRGQGYDNGSNMVGAIKGVKTRINDKYPRAFFNPCGCHSLNLIAGDAAKSSVKSVSLFGVLQRLYTIFSSSTKRWAVLKEHVKELAVKDVCETRWECRIHSVKAVRYQYEQVCDALDNLADEAKDPKISSEARSLLLHLLDFSFIVALVIWYDVLFQINLASKSMQSKEFDISETVNLLACCKRFLTEYREAGFEAAKIAAKETAAQIKVEPKFKSRRCRKKKKIFFQYEGKDETHDDPEKLFQTEVFYPLVDTMLSSISTRFEQMKHHSSVWGFLYNIKTLPDRDSLLNKCMLLQKELQARDMSDIDGKQLSEELIRIQFIIEQCSSSSPINVLQYIKHHNMEGIFPNVWIAMRILLTIPVSVASGERSFSKLKLIKNYLRSTMAQERLSSLALLSIENQIAKNLDFSKLIQKFAAIKARKVLT